MMISKSLVVAASLFLASIPAFAVPINITISGGIDVVAGQDLGNYGDGTVLSWLGSDITAYNTLHGTTLAAPTANADSTALLKVTTGSGPSSVTLSLNNAYGYIFLHWGGQGGGWEQAYFLNGYSGSFEFDAPPGGHPAVGGLSFYSFYGPAPRVPSTQVPDGANTGILLGLAFVGLFAVRKFATANAA
jgi:hypothetical protein